jgi:hypothetical protein
VLSRHLAALGSWVTVLAIAIDPFTQQIIRPITCHNIQSDSIARVPRANNLTGLSLQGDPELIEAGMASAIYVGLLGDVKLTAVQCSTGNCTFASPLASKVNYQTLAIDAACVDVTDETKVSGNTSTWYIPRLGNETTASGEKVPIHTTTNGDKIQFPEYWTASSLDYPSFSPLPLK